MMAVKELLFFLVMILPVMAPPPPPAPDGTNFQLSFPNKTVNDYARIDIPSSASPLTAFTVCMWIKVGDQSDDGTLFSYSLPDEDNELLLTDYSRFKLLIGGSKRTMDDLSANDDQWHHICTTWENSGGSWNFSIDGVLKDSGEDFQTGHVINSGGILILGQDQDEYGGGFEQSQSFFGEMYGVNVWSNVLSADEILRMSESCFSGEGNYMSWHITIPAQLHGDVSIKAPTTCKP